VEHSVIKSDESQRERKRDSLFMGAKISIVNSAIAVPTVIRNLSVGGVMIDCSIGLRKGARVNLNLRNIGNVAGCVTWVRDGRAGVMFDDPIDPDDVRSSIKKPKVRTPEVKGASLAPLSEGSHVEVNVPGIGLLHGCVDWIEDKRMGLSFESSLLDR